MKFVQPVGCSSVPAPPGSASAAAGNQVPPPSRPTRRHEKKRRKSFQPATCLLTCPRDLTINDAHQGNEVIRSPGRPFDVAAILTVQPSRSSRAQISQVAVPWVRPGQLLDASSQRRLFIAKDGHIAEAGPGQIQRRDTRRCGTSKWPHNSWRSDGVGGRSWLFFQGLLEHAAVRRQLGNQELEPIDLGFGSEMRSCSLDTGSSWRAFQR